MESKVPKILGRFFFEFVTIVTAVLLSFTINAWQLEREDRMVELNLLRQIKSNIELDTAVLHRNIRISKMIIEEYDKVLAIDDLADIRPDSINSQLDLVITYTKFKSVDIGFQEMQQTGTSYLIQNKEVLKQVIKLYTFWYGYVEEWNQIDSDHILHRMIPHMDENFPYSEWNAYDKLLENNPNGLFRCLQDNTFRNLLRTNREFKRSVLMFYETNLEQAAATLQVLDEEIARLEE
jgi:hypothetical protein